MGNDIDKSNEESSPGAATSSEQVTQSLLELFARLTTRREYLESVVDVLRRWTGCRCVGIRILSARGDIPYAAHAGFSKEFWEHENWLNVKKDTCACIRVILRQPEPQDRPLMTPFGSFQCNDTMAFVGRLSPEEQTRFRGMCVRVGFASVAVVPIRSGEQMLGAIHLADERRDMVTAAKVSCIETIVPLIGEAIRRFDAEEALREQTEEVTHYRDHLQQMVIDRTAALTEANDRLQRQQRIIDAISDNILANVAYFDRDFNFLRVNDTYVRGSGHTREQLIGRNHFELFPNAENEAIFRRVRETREPYIARAKPFIFADQPQRGVTYWDWWLRPIIGPDRQVEGLVLSLVDVTDVVRARQEVEDLNRRLREANAAKDQFLAMLSHELRTPLTPALIMASAMEKDDRLEPWARDDSATIRQSIELETRLIDDLLDLTRISRGKLDLKLGCVDVHERLRNAITVCGADARAKEIAICVALEATAHTMSGDGARLEQVFWNLVKNAVKFTPAGGRIHVHSRNDSSGQLVIEVADNGIGIPPDVLPTIFEAFEQGGSRTTHRFGGLGLGLAISRAIVDLHGGRIAAHSDGDGHGATMRVFLPAIGAADVPPQPETPEQPRANARGRGLRILLVEDHESTAAVMSRLLAALNHAVKWAATVQGALELAAANEFDLVISDLGLPDGTGTELMCQLREQYGLRGVAISGFGMEQDIQRSREAGFAAHLTKPINVQQLEAAIDALV